MTGEPDWLRPWIGPMQDQPPAPPDDEGRSKQDGTQESASPAMEPAPTPTSAFPMAVLVEGGMGLLALGLGWLLGFPLGETIRWEGADVLRGLAATVPLVGVLLVCVHVPIGVLQDLLRTIDRFVVPLFRRWRVGEMAMVAALAGLGEEMLFRGVLQNALAHWVGGSYGVWAGWVLASVLFGVVHAVSTTYALLATGIGFYLGGLWIVTRNLLVPVVAHGVYDFLALVYLVRIRGR